LKIQQDDQNLSFHGLADTCLDHLDLDLDLDG
jgi:hypothetical protein